MVKVDTRKLLLRTFRDYLVKHEFAVESHVSLRLVNADSFYTHAFKVFADEAHQHLSPLYVESVLHNAGIAMCVVSPGSRTEEYCYDVSQDAYQKLLTLY